MARSSRDMINATLQWVARANYGYPISPSDSSGMQIGALPLTETESSWLNQTGWYWDHFAEVSLYKACSKHFFLVVRWNKSRGCLQESFQNSFRQWLWKTDCNVSTLLPCAKHSEIGRINNDGRKNPWFSRRCLNIWYCFANLSGWVAWIYWFYTSFLAATEMILNFKMHMQMQKKKIIVNGYYTLMACPFCKSLYDILGNRKQFPSQGHKNHPQIYDGHDYKTRQSRSDFHFLLVHVIS